MSQGFFSSGSHCFTFGYDSASNLTSFTGPSGQTTLVYDNLNRLTDINEPSGDRTYYGYDWNGRVSVDNSVRIKCNLYGRYLDEPESQKSVQPGI